MGSKRKGQVPRTTEDECLDDLSVDLAGADSPEAVAEALGRHIRGRSEWKAAALVWPETAGLCRVWDLCAQDSSRFWRGPRRDMEESTEVGPAFAAPLMAALREDLAVRVDSGPEEFSPYLILQPAPAGRDGGGGRQPSLRFASLFRMAARLHSLNALLSNAKAQWEKAFDAASEVFVLHGPDGRIFRANTALSALTGIPIRRCIGKACAEILPGLCTGHDAAGIEWKCSQDGPHFLATTQTVNLGGEAATLHILRDVTEERRLAAAQEDRRTRDLVRNILQGIAHEIRNPLFGIQTLLQALDLRHAQDDQERVFTEKALREIHRLDAIVRRFLQLAFLDDATPPESGALEDLISQAAALLESRSPRPVRERIRPSASLRDRPVLVHRRSFVEALAEILDNACQFSPPDQPIDVSARWGEDHWELEVRDRGLGVAPGLEEKVLEPFFTTVPSRSGLGLTLAQAGMNRDGGRLTVGRSEATSGAAILIRFPLPRDRSDGGP